MTQGISFLDFCNELAGYNFFTKKKNILVYKYQLYWQGITPAAVFKKYNYAFRPKEETKQS